MSSPYFALGASHSALCAEGINVFFCLFRFRILALAFDAHTLEALANTVWPRMCQDRKQVNQLVTFLSPKSKFIERILWIL